MLLVAGESTELEMKISMNESFLHKITSRGSSSIIHILCSVDFLKVRSYNTGQYMTKAKKNRLVYNIELSSLRRNNFMAYGLRFLPCEVVAPCYQHHYMCLSSLINEQLASQP